METLTQNKEIDPFNHLTAIQNQDASNAGKDEFKPKGAIAFFVLLITLCLAVWYGIYFLMLQRN